MFSSRLILRMGTGHVIAAVSVLYGMSMFLVVHSAPTSLISANDGFKAMSKLTSQTELTHEKPLIRTKRAEEILYGNHQNAPRVKKSDPAAAAAPAPVEGQIHTKTGDDVIKTDDNTLAPEENGSHADTEEQTLPEEKQDEEQGEEEGEAANEQNNLEDIPIEVDEAEYPKYYETSIDDSEQQGTIRKKRNTKTAALMTAENMVAIGNIASVANRPVRTKRDLDYEELRELLENSRVAPYELEDDSRPVAVIPMLPETVNDGEDEQEVGEEEVDEEENGPMSVAIPYAYGPRYDGSSEKEELIRELVEKKAEEETKEKLIDYLLASAIASETETREDDDGGEEEVDDDGRFVVEVPGHQNYDENAEDDPVAIGSVAAKRNVFYPYSYEPYGGRWGAMVPGAKRSADEYERLYRLAEALRADEDYEEN